MIGFKDVLTYDNVKDITDIASAAAKGATFTAITSDMWRDAIDTYFSSLRLTTTSDYYTAIEQLFLPPIAAITELHSQRKQMYVYSPEWENLNDQIATLLKSKQQEYARLYQSAPHAIVLMACKTVVQACRDLLAASRIRAYHDLPETTKSFLGDLKDLWQALLDRHFPEAKSQPSTAFQDSPRQLFLDQYTAVIEKLSELIRNKAERNEIIAFVHQHQDLLIKDGTLGGFCLQAISEQNPIAIDLLVNYGKNFSYAVLQSALAMATTQSDSYLFTALIPFCSHFSAGHLGDVINAAAASENINTLNALLPIFHRSGSEFVKVEVAFKTAVANQKWKAFECILDHFGPESLQDALNECLESLCFKETPLAQLKDYLDRFKALLTQEDKITAAYKHALSMDNLPAAQMIRTVLGVTPVIEPAALKRMLKRRTQPEQAQQVDMLWELYSHTLSPQDRKELREFAQEKSSQKLLNLLNTAPQNDLASPAVTEGKAPVTPGYNTHRKRERPNADEEARLRKRRARDQSAQEEKPTKEAAPKKENRWGLGNCTIS